jgi:site-specific DNA recombinase
VAKPTIENRAAVAYFRMSDIGQEASIPEQRGWATTVARKEKAAIVRTFEDPAIPGSEIERRPGLMEMVEFCEQRFKDGRPIAILIVWDLDRLSRASSIRTCAMLDRLQQAGISRILTADGWVDLEDDGDLLQLHVKQDFTRAAYSKGIAKNVARSCADRAAKGWWVAGRPPFGYQPIYLETVGKDGKKRRTPTTLEPGDPAEVEAVQFIFDRYVTTAASLGELVQLLEAAGMPPPRARRRRKGGGMFGGKWSRPAVRMILVCPHYTGDMVYNTTRQGKYYSLSGKDKEVQRVRGVHRRRHVKTEPEERIITKDAHAPLVSREVWAQAQAKLRSNKWTYDDAGKLDRHSGRRGEWILSGKVYCGACGNRMVGHTYNHKRGDKTYTYRRYICRANYLKGPGTCRTCAAQQDTLVKEVARAIQKIFADPQRLDDFRRQVEKVASVGAGASVKARARLEKQVAELDKEIHHGRERLLVIPEDLIAGVADVIRAKEKEREKAAAELTRLDAVADLTVDQGRQFREALNVIQTLEESISEATPTELRDVFALWVDKVTLHFKPPIKRDCGRCWNVLDDIEIEFRPEVAHLLGNGT